MSTTALLTDRYEFTMLDAALRDGTANMRCAFEVFARDLPDGRSYGVVAGLGRLLDHLELFRFDDDTLAWLDDGAIVSPSTLAWLADYRFRGDIHAYQEGELFVPRSPVMTVIASFGEAVLLETLALSILNYDSAVASAASRMVTAAAGRPLMEFGSRRAHEQAAIAAARSAYLVGFASTSNLEAGRRWGMPTSGTVAHAFVMLHEDERAAFDSQLAAAGAGTTLLVDTFDTTNGTAAAIDAAYATPGGTLGAIRIDSGDLASDARSARAQLDDAGLTSTRIVLSGDLDEHRIAELASAPADAYGVGTSVVTGSGAPTAGFIYKLVARADDAGRWRDVTKAGGIKATVGGRKRAARRLDRGIATSEVLLPWDAPAPADTRALQTEIVRDGEVVHRAGLDEIRAHHRAVIAELPATARRLDAGTPFIGVDDSELALTARQPPARSQG